MSFFSLMCGVVSLSLLGCIQFARSALLGRGVGSWWGGVLHLCRSEPETGLPAR